MPAPTQDAATSIPTRQQARASARHRNRLSQARFAGYLAATAGCYGLATSADAAVISIDITNPNILGPNGGVPFSQYGTYTVTVPGWPVTQSSSDGLSFSFPEIRNDNYIDGLGGSLRQSGGEFRHVWAGRPHEVWYGRINRC